MMLAVHEGLEFVDVWKTPITKATKSFGIEIPYDTKGIQPGYKALTQVGVSGPGKAGEIVKDHPAFKAESGTGYLDPNLIFTILTCCRAWDDVAIDIVTSFLAGLQNIPRWQSLLHLGTSSMKQAITRIKDPSAF